MLQKTKIQMKKMMLENLAFSVKLIFMHKNWYSQNPRAQLSSNMYISFRFISLLRPHCAPNDTQLTVFQEVEKTRRIYVMYSIKKVPLSLAHIISFYILMTCPCDRRSTMSSYCLNVFATQQRICQQSHQHKVECKQKKTSQTVRRNLPGFTVV